MNFRVMQRHRFYRHRSWSGESCNSAPHQAHSSISQKCKKFLFINYPVLILLFIGLQNGLNPVQISPSLHLSPWWKQNVILHLCYNHQPILIQQGHHYFKRVKNSGYHLHLHRILQKIPHGNQVASDALIAGAHQNAPILQPIATGNKNI